MTLEDLRKEKKQLEHDIAVLIGQRLKDFNETTGVSPCSLSVHLIPTVKVGQKHPTYIIGEVRAGIEI